MHWASNMLKLLKILVLLLSLLNLNIYMFAQRFVILPASLKCVQINHNFILWISLSASFLFFFKLLTIVGGFMSCWNLPFITEYVYL